MHARGSGEAARRAKRGLSCSSDLVRAMHGRGSGEAATITRVAICVSRVLLDGLQKKETLLVVYYIS